MRTIMLVAVLALGTGCKSKIEEALGDISSLRDKMCACKDAKCAEGVKAEFKKTTEKYQGDNDAEKKATVEQRQQIDAVFSEYMACAAKLELAR